ncbi:MAG: peptidoglycan D,D-transpeptidase FtsI family protein [Armatimonadota bacterium]
MAADPDSISKTRLRLATVLVLLALAALGLRSAQLMVVDRDQVLDLERYVVAGQREPRLRPGDILDSEGQPLAISVELTQICANPGSLDDADRLAIARVLAAQLGLDESFVRERLAGDRSYSVIKTHVDPATARAVQALRLPGVFTERAYERLYPQGPLCANVIGFREKSADLTGLAGLEKGLSHILDSPWQPPGLSPWAGALEVGLSVRPAPLSGPAVVLTIDHRIQAAAELGIAHCLAEFRPRAASCTVLDPRTGAILAMASVPTFDPNEFQRVATAQQWSRFDNLCASRAWEPGSVAKVLVVASALEAGVITPASRLVCTGTRTVAGKTIGCWGRWRARGHGTQRVADVVANSCNMGASQISTRIGASQFPLWMAEFGLGRSTRSGLFAEASGQLPDPATLDPVTLATLGFGQGMSVTDLQLAAAVGVIANDGVLMRPHIVKESRTPNGRLLWRTEPEKVADVISPKTARLVLDMMRGVVERGTGRRAAIPGSVVAGKTGTAQKVAPGREREGYAPDKFISSFVGIAGCETNRPIVVVVSVDEPAGGGTGGLVAAPVFREVAEAALRHLGTLPVVTAAGGRHGHAS